MYLSGYIIEGGDGTAELQRVYLSSCVKNVNPISSPAASPWNHMTQPL